jgi:hypothetical protein
MSDTLPQPQFIDPNIPIVTPDGGSNAAYKNPNSPESIMKKTKMIDVQSKTDTQFDVAVSPYHESFVGHLINVIPYICVILIICMNLLVRKLQYKYIYIGGLLFIVLLLALVQREYGAI